MAGFGLTLLIVVVLVTLAYRTTKANQEANAWVTHTLEVMGTADQALSGLADMETGYRGFLVTGEDDFLEPYKNGKIAYAVKLKELQTKTADNPVQVGRWKDLEQRAAAWQQEVTEPGMKIRRAIAAGEADNQEIIDFETSGLGKTHFDGMRAVFAQAVGAEEILLEERSSANEKSGNTLEGLVNILLWGTLAIIGLGLGIAHLLANVISRPLKEVTRQQKRVWKQI